MLTLRGRTLVAIAAGCLLFGRVVALREFTMLGVAVGVIVGAGVLSVRIRSGKVDVRRRVWPTRIVAGQDVRVDLDVRNRGPSSTGPVLLTDRVPERLGETARVALESGARRQATYLLGARSRGVYEIGPLEVTYTDAFGSVQRTVEAPGTSTLVVYPSFDRISTMPSGVQRLGAVRHSPLIGQGEDFYALREYEEGDDMRKVHWPSSLKMNKLVIRQEEFLGEPRAVILLDTCGSKHRGSDEDSSMEVAVSAAASVAVLAAERRMRVDILTPDGPLLETSRPSREQMLEALAGVNPSERSDISGALATLDPRRSGGAAVAVVITPKLGRSEVAQVARLVTAVPGGALVWIAADTFAPSPAARRSRARPPQLGLPLVAIERGTDFRRAWEGGVRVAALAR